MAFRKLKGLFSSEKAPEIYTVTPKPNMEIRFHREEQKRYTLFFQMIDYDDDGYVGGKEGAQFLRRSQLPDATLREVWRWACGGVSQQQLDRDSWLVALKLVACGQAGYDCTLEALETHQDELELADMNYGIEAQLEHSSPEPVAPSSIGVTVKDPAVSGSGLQKHVLYTVNTSVRFALFVCWLRRKRLLIYFWLLTY